MPLKGKIKYMKKSKKKKVAPKKKKSYGKK